MTNKAAIIANLELLEARLWAALTASHNAISAYEGGQHDLGLGTILDLQTLLPEIDALYRIVITLHRSPEISPASGVQGRILQTLREALAALNTAPCFRVPSLPDRTNSYDIASRLGKVLNEIAPPTAPP
jgi:hypothetical protein